MLQPIPTFDALSARLSHESTGAFRSGRGRGRGVMGIQGKRTMLVRRVDARPDHFLENRP